MTGSDNRRMDLVADFTRVMGASGVSIGPAHKRNIEIERVWAAGGGRDHVIFLEWICARKFGIALRMFATRLLLSVRINAKERGPTFQIRRFWYPPRPNEYGSPPPVLLVSRLKLVVSREIGNGEPLRGTFRNISRRTSFCDVLNMAPNVCNVLLDNSRRVVFGCC